MQLNTFICGISCKEYMFFSSNTNRFKQWANIGYKTFDLILLLIMKHQIMLNYLKKIDMSSNLIMHYESNLYLDN